MGATAVLEMAAEIPPAKKSLANETAVSDMVLFWLLDVPFRLTSTQDKPHCPLEKLACTDEMADCEAARGIYVTQSSRYNTGTLAPRYWPMIQRHSDSRQLQHMRRGVLWMRHLSVTGVEVNQKSPGQTEIMQTNQL